MGAQVANRAKMAMMFSFNHAMSKWRSGSLFASKWKMTDCEGTCAKYVFSPLGAYLFQSQSDFGHSTILRFRPSSNLRNSAMPQFSDLGREAEPHVHTYLDEVRRAMQYVRQIVYVVGSPVSLKLDLG
jgi:hypothetical protein